MSPRQHRNYLPSLLVLAILLATSCDRTTTGPEHGGLAMVISDGAHNGNVRFFFLPPILPQPAYAGVTDPAASPEIMVCEWNGTSCLSVVAAFSMTAGTDAEVIRYDAAAQQYQVDWHTNRCVTGPCALDPAKTYRLRVLVGAIELGFADLDVVSSSQGLKNVQTGEYIGLVGGRTLPVKFRIEQGAVVVLTPGGSAAVGPGGGNLTTADGLVGLVIPDGALSSSTSISTAVVAPPAEGTGPWAPVIQFGPDGTTFAEPVTLTLAYTPENLPEGVPDSALGIFTFDGTGWEEVPGGTVNQTDNTVSVSIAHFSYYWVGIRPNEVRWNGGFADLIVGRSTTVTATIGYCVQIFVGPNSWVCQNYPQRNLLVTWNTTNAAVMTVPSTRTYTNANGEVVSPPITGRSPGSAAIGASSIVGSAGVRLVVLGQLGLLPRTASNVAGWSYSQRITQSVALPADLSVALLNRNGFLTIGESGTSNYTYGGQTGTYVLPAGTISKTLVAAGLNGVGTDTLIASAAGFAPDTAVITLVQGKFLVSGWPATLAFGDSAALTLTVADQNGVLGNLGYPIAVTLTPDDGLVFTNGNAVITTLPVQQRTSATFYVKATAIGPHGISITHRDYVTYTNAVNIVGQPITWQPRTATIVAGWSVPLRFGVATAMAADLDVSLSNLNSFLGVFEGPTYTAGGQTGHYTLSAGTTTKALTISGGNGPGVDTLIVGAPGFLPDTAIITLVQGTIQLSGWPASLMVGDSAALTVTLADQNGVPNASLGTAIDIALTPSSGLTMSDGHGPISAVHVPQRTSATFYVKATATGSQSLGFSHRDYVTYSASLTGTAPPTIHVNPSTVTIQVQQGASNTGTIQITNSGGGTLSGLTTGSFSNYFNGSPAPWATASLSSTTAPATLTITAAPGLSVGAGVHQLRFDLNGPGATNSPVTFYSINVTVVAAGVNPVNATISANPSSLAFPVTQGQSASRQIAISNSGTDPLTNLTVGAFSNYYNGQPAPWVTATVSPTTAPATITVTAAPDMSIPVGNHLLRFDVASPGATNSPLTFYSISVTVTPSMWSVGVPMPTARWGMAAAAVGNIIYTIGGNATNHEPYPGGPTTGIVEAFDVTTETWFPRQSLPVAREYSMTALYEGQIYVFGGWLGNLSADRRTFIYDPSSDSWTQGADAPFPVFGGVAAEINGRIYVTTSGCCGSPEGGFLRFEPLSGQWTQLPGMPHGHDFPAGGASIDGKLYVVGGQGPSAYLDVYDPATGSWATKESLPLARQYGSGLGHQGKLYVFGGNVPNATDGMLEVFVYDPANDTWATETLAPRERSFPSAIEVNGRAYIIGGNTGRTSPASPIGVVERFILPNDSE